MAYLQYPDPLAIRGDGDIFPFEIPVGYLLEEAKKAVQEYLDQMTDGKILLTPKL